MLRVFRGLIAVPTALCLLVSTTVFAQTPADGAKSKKSDTDTKEPVLLNADRMTYDDQLGLVTANGNVELIQGRRILLADTVTYNENADIVTASGNVKLLDPDGKVTFGDYAELTREMKDGFIDGLRMLMVDNSRLAGLEGERADGRFTQVNHGVYSPCNLCKSDPTAAPLWQMTGTEVDHDNQTHDITYYNGFMEMWGVPVLYIPYMVHPDPTVDRRTGVLSPTFEVNNNVGVFVRDSYYFNIDPMRSDATVEVGDSANDGPYLGGEWRQRLDNGRFILQGSMVDAAREDSGGTSRQAVREDVFGSGVFEYNDEIRYGFDLQQVSDNSYLLRYGINSADILTSRLYADYFSGRDYADISGYRFEDLRPGHTETVPLVAPAITSTFMGEPDSLLGGRWRLDTGAIGISRESSNSTGRVNTTAEWERDFYTPFGLVTNVSGSAVEAAYTVVNLPRPDMNNVLYNGELNRFLPSGTVLMRYPFVRTTENTQQIVQPEVAFTAAPPLTYSSKYPDEDSSDVDFDDTNLFSTNRFTGIDRLEGGERVTYGMNGQIFGTGSADAWLLDRSHVTAFFGQSTRFTDDGEYPAGSGLENHESDYVGSLGLGLSPYFDGHYSFRLDRNSFRPRREDINASAGVPLARVSATVTFVDRPDNAPIGTVNDQLNASLSSQVTTNWALIFTDVRNINEGGSGVLSQIDARYKDECFTLDVLAKRDYTQRTDVSSGDSITFQLTFKNLGEIVKAPLRSTAF